MSTKGCKAWVEYLLTHTVDFSETDEETDNEVDTDTETDTENNTENGET